VDEGLSAKICVVFEGRDTAWSPWYVADADDKKRARLNIISHLLSQVPYEPLAHRDVKLPRRQQPDGYVPPELRLRHVPRRSSRLGRVAIRHG
jgi:polyphosphate kinase